MNEAEHLRLLIDVLTGAQLSDAGSLGQTANEIESVVSSLTAPSVSLRLAFSELWEALEVLGVQHQETGAEPTKVELTQLVALASRLRVQAESEIASHSSETEQLGQARDA